MTVQFVRKEATVKLGHRVAPKLNLANTSMRRFRETSTAKLEPPLLMEEPASPAGTASWRRQSSRVTASFAKLERIATTSTQNV